MKDMPPQSESTNINKSVKKIVIFGCLTAFALVTVFTLCGGAAFWFVYNREETPTLDTGLTVPAITDVGEQIKMHVEVSNSNNESVTLESIDIDDEFLEGFQVLGVEPKSRDTSHILVFNQRTWIFDKPVAPNQKLVITFSLRPINAGRYSGNVDVMTPSLDYTSQFADVVVNP